MGHLSECSVMMQLSKSVVILQLFRQVCWIGSAADLQIQRTNSTLKCASVIYREMVILIARLLRSVLSFHKGMGDLE